MYKYRVALFLRGLILEDFVDGTWSENISRSRKKKKNTSKMAFNPLQLLNIIHWGKIDHLF